MAVDESARHRLHTKLEELLGPERAAALMEYLPPTGWADVARRADLEHYAQINQREHERLAETLRKEMEGLGRRLVMWMSSMIVAAVGLAFVVGRLA